MSFISVVVLMFIIQYTILSFVVKSPSPEDEVTITDKILLLSSIHFFIAVIVYSDKIPSGMSNGSFMINIAF